ncbi:MULTISPECIES: hypothetical protein [Pseudomonas]|uniref:Uncharacterized protein n=1 Tax=Pseudomonas eucalypticola TaxID=2599595 RepID=A0A7D5D849_9PSED|nr:MULTISPECIES: hypothetical protein [Pseudomonas]QKZ05914.1 hypothetical protein HWQ56_19840 [Pseudomonas eucalypticola]
MFKGFMSKDYSALLLWGSVIAVVLLVCAFIQKPLDALAWVQAVAVVIALMLAVFVPAIQRKQEGLAHHKRWREEQVGLARRLQYLVLEFQELLNQTGLGLAHWRATDRHRMQAVLQDYLHRLFESHKQDNNDDRIVIAHELRQVVNALIDELESGRSDRAVLQGLEKRLQKLAQRGQANVLMAERG